MTEMKEQNTRVPESRGWRRVPCTETHTATAHAIVLGRQMENSDFGTTGKWGQELIYFYFE